MLRDFMVNYYSRRFHRGIHPVPCLVILESEKELEILAEERGISDLEKRIKLATQSPQRTAKIIRCWLQENERCEYLKRG